MSTSRIEELLQDLVLKQDELISRLESLEQTVGQNLTDLSSALADVSQGAKLIYDELNWWDKKPSFAREILSTLANIESEVSK